MKKRKPARKQAKQRGKIGRLRASADVENLSPESGTEWRRYYRPLKTPITLRLDADVLAWFKKQGRGYQTRINRTLRKAMAEGKG
jgi:uncharacterized protein (DUF4415 family)